MKRLFLLFIILFAVLYSSNIIAQEISAMRKSLNINIPEKILQPLGDPLPAGTYSIGSSGYFPTIDSAFNKLNLDGIAGSVILELIDNFYQAPDNSSFVLLGPIQGADPLRTVTIRPAANKNVVVQTNGYDGFHFINVSYLTLDGVGLTGLTTLMMNIQNNDLWPIQSAIDFENDCDFNVVTNVTVVVEDYINGWGIDLNAIIAGSTNTPDYNLLQNNFIKQAGIGIIAAGFRSGATVYSPVGNTIKDNKIGSESDSLIAWGVQSQNCQSTLIENNIVQNIRNYKDYVCPGLNAFGDYGTIIRNNIVHNIYESTGNEYGVHGISLTGSGIYMGVDNLIYNNIVYDIQSSAPQTNKEISGIKIWCQTNPGIYFNTIYLEGTGPGINSSAALYIRQVCTNVSVKNNVLINKRNDAPKCASSIYVEPGSTIIADYNDLLYVTSPNNCLVRAGGIDYMTLQEWQTTGNDLHSFEEQPHFISSTDMHIDKTFPTNLESGATPVAGITIDIDGDTRNASTPDIGADEFAGFTFEDPLPAGTYTIGTGGNFATIQDAFTKLETDGVAGNVTLELIDELYTAPTDTFGFKLNGPIPGAGPISRVTIKPAENKNVLIQGSCRDQLAAINTSYVTIDGVSLTGPTTLTIHALYSNQFGWNAGIEFIDNSDHNIFRNITFISDDINRAGGGPGLYTRAGINAVPDSNLIENNFIKKCGVGAIYLAFNNATLRGTGNIIRGNFIGSETDSTLGWGIQIEHAQNTIVENNIIRNLKHTPTQVTDIINVGINSFSGLGDIIRNNVVHGVRSSNGYSAIGILLSGGPIGSNNLVYNNMVYDIQSTSTQSDSRVAGIQMWQQNNPKIYYNTVYLTGIGSNYFGSACLRIHGTTTTADVKNNIFVNMRDESPYCASAIFDYSNTNLTSDYNVFFYDDLNTNNCLVRAGLDFHTLAEWQAENKDLHSYIELPHFVEPYLHIDDTIATYIESRGIPITGIDTDFDGDLRNSTNPDIGADELDGIVGVEDEETLPTEYVLEQNYPNPFNPSTKISWQSPVGSQQTLKIYDILGNEVATLVDEYKPAGRYEIEFSAGALSSGIYFYQLTAGEFVQTRKMILIK